MIKKIKCFKCKKDAVFIEKKIYYCGLCAVDKFVKLRERLQSKSINNNSKNNVTRI